MEVSSKCCMIAMKHDSSMSFCMGRGGFLPKLADEGHDSVSIKCNKNRHVFYIHILLCTCTKNTNTLLNQLFSSDHKSSHLFINIMTIKFIKVF